MRTKMQRLICFNFNKILYILYDKVVIQLGGKSIFGGVNFSFRVPLAFPDRQGVRSEPTIMRGQKLA
jgi:hypothetical protein